MVAFQNTRTKNCGIIMGAFFFSCTECSSNGFAGAADAAGENASAAAAAADIFGGSAPAAEPEDRSKMTKDSNMALFAKAPPQQPHPPPPPQQQQQMFLAQNGTGGF